MTDGPRDAVPVVCAIIEHAGRILACRRGPQQSNAGLWEFPGGKMRAGESPEEALVREINEELVVTVAPHTPLTPVTYVYPWITVRLIPFICRIMAGALHPREHAEIRWVDQREAMALDWAPADEPVVKDYYKKADTA